MPRYTNGRIVTRWARQTFASGTAIACGAISLDAQPRPFPLPQAEASFPEPFSSVTGLRELRDGRVLVADGRERTLQLLDFARGTATPVARRGAGPGEWSFPTRLHPYPGDSTLMVDAGNNRWLLIAPDGSATRSVPIPGGLSPFQHELVGIDDASRMLLVAGRRPKSMTDGAVGAADVLRYDARRARLDTVAVLTQPTGEVSAARMLPGGMMQLSTNRPLAAQDLCGLAPDGHIAILRASPYRVEWMTPTGGRLVGPTAPTPGIRVNEAERNAFLKAQIRPGAIQVAGSGAPVSRPGSGSAGGAAPSRPRTPRVAPSDLESVFNPDMSWPAVKPPFLADAMHVAPDGRVWVLRTRAHDDPIPTYDIFDADGRLAARRSLPPRSRLVGFGRTAIYLARSDDDDLLWLDRVPER